MKIETKKIDATRIQLGIEVPSEVVKKKFDDVYEKLGQEAKIPGFRPGKAPRDVLEKHHSRTAREEVIRNLIPEAYKDSLEREKINVVELPEISEVKLESNVLSFKAVVEVRPEIELKDYKNLKLKYQKVTLAPDEIDKTLDKLKEAHKWFDYAHHERQVIDDKFARGLGYATVTAMRGSIERQLLVQKENDARYQLQEDLLKQIMGQVNFKVPQSLVGRRLEELIREAKVQLGMRGATKEQIASQEDKLRKELFPEAEAQVKTFLVLEEIAKKEGISQDDEHLSQRVIEFLLSQANWIEE